MNGESSLASNMTKNKRGVCMLYMIARGARICMGEEGRKEGGGREERERERRDEREHK